VEEKSVNTLSDKVNEKMSPANKDVYMIDCTNGTDDTRGILLLNDLRQAEKAIVPLKRLVFLLQNDKDTSEAAHRLDNQIKVCDDLPTIKVSGMAFKIAHFRAASGAFNDQMLLMFVELLNPHGAHALGLQLMNEPLQESAQEHLLVSNLLNILRKGQSTEEVDASKTKLKELLRIICGHPDLQMPALQILNTALQTDVTNLNKVVNHGDYTFEEFKEAKKDLETNPKCKFHKAFTLFDVGIVLMNEASLMLFRYEADEGYLVEIKATESEISKLALPTVSNICADGQFQFPNATEWKAIHKSLAYLRANASERFLKMSAETFADIDKKSAECFEVLLEARRVHFHASLGKAIAELVKYYTKEMAPEKWTASFTTEDTSDQVSEQVVLVTALLDEAKDALKTPYDPSQFFVTELVWRTTEFDQSMLEFINIITDAVLPILLLETRPVDFKFKPIASLVNFLNSPTSLRWQNADAAMSVLEQIRHRFANNGIQQIVEAMSPMSGILNALARKADLSEIADEKLLGDIKEDNAYPA